MRLIFLIIIALSVNVVYSQNCNPPFRTEPSSFTAEDEVTIIADISGCPNSTLANLSQAYIWIFLADGTGPDGVGGNGDFCGGSNEELAMTQNDDGEWTFTFTPTNLFAATPGEIGDQISFIVKPFAAACDGSGDQTENLSISVAPLEFIPSETRNFPSRITQKDFVTVYYNPEESGNQELAMSDEIYVYTWATRTDSDGNPKPDAEVSPWVEVGDNPDLMATRESNGEYSLTIYPLEFYPLDEGDIVTGLNYIFRNKEGTVQIDAHTITPVN